MQNAQYPDFKAGFKYQNIGNIVGTLNYAKELKRKDESIYGWEFLINAKGFGSVNVRIPMMDRAQSSIDNFPVEDKPRVRAGLTRIEQFTTDKGKTYTNATTFVELSEAVTVNGDKMNDNIAGRVAGEVFDIQPIQGQSGAAALKLKVVTYPTDKNDEKKRAVQSDGTPVDPQVLTFEVHDTNVINQLQQTVRQGSNIEIGYKYFNKSMVQYDEYGYPINDENNTIERLEIGKLTVHGASQNQGAFGGGFGGQQKEFGNQQQQGFGGQRGFGQQDYQQKQQSYGQQNGFGQQQQGGFGQQQQQQGNPFGNQQQQNFGQSQQQTQQQNFGDPNQYNMPNEQIPFMSEYQQPQGNPQGGFGQMNDPFQGQGSVIQEGSPAYEDAQRAFGNAGGQQNGFGFGN